MILKSSDDSSVRLNKQANGLGNVTYEIGPKYGTKVNKT